MSTLLVGLFNNSKNLLTDFQFYSRINLLIQVYEPRRQFDPNFFDMDWVNDVKLGLRRKLGRVKSKKNTQSLKK